MPCCDYDARTALALTCLHLRCRRAGLSVGSHQLRSPASHVCACVCRRACSMMCATRMLHARLHRPASHVGARVRRRDERSEADQRTVLKLPPPLPHLGRKRSHIRNRHVVCAGMHRRRYVLKQTTFVSHTIRGIRHAPYAWHSTHHVVCAGEDSSTAVWYALKHSGTNSLACTHSALP